MKEVLSSIESLDGHPLPLEPLARNTTALFLSLFHFPPSITCSSCIKEAYNVIVRDFPAALSSMQPATEAACGVSFVGQYNCTRGPTFTKRPFANDRWFYSSRHHPKRLFGLSATAEAVGREIYSHPRFHGFWIFPLVFGYL